MIERIDAAIKQIVLTEMARMKWSEPIDVSFDVEEAKSQGARVLFELIALTEDTTRRAEPFVYRRKPGEDKTALRRPNPIYLSALYSVTVEAPSTGVSHSLLTYVLGGLFRHPTIPVEDLNGEIVVASASIAQPEDRDPRKRDRLSVDFRVTFPFRPFDSDEVPLVTHAFFAMGQGKREEGLKNPVDLRSIRVSAAGIVRSDSGKPLSDASIWVEGEEREAITDGEGRFVLLNASTGDHEVVVTKSGFRPVRTTLCVGSSGPLRDLPDTVIELTPLSRDELLADEAKRRDPAGKEGVPVQTVRKATVTLVGQLHWKSGSPAAYVPVRCGEAATVTNRQGIYSFPNAHSVDAVVFADLPGVGAVAVSDSMIEDLPKVS